MQTYATLDNFQVLKTLGTGYSGKVKLGRVTLQHRGRYTWEAAGRAGASEDLEKAKQAVELAVAVADKQPDLFR